MNYILKEVLTSLEIKIHCHPKFCLYLDFAIHDIIVELDQWKRDQPRPKYK